MFLLKPFPGKHVRNPETKALLNDDGVKVEKIDTYWHRRLQDKDVFIVDPKLQSAFESNQLVVAKPEKQNKNKGV